MGTRIRSTRPASADLVAFCCVAVLLGGLLPSPGFGGQPVTVTNDGSGGSARSAADTSKRVVKKPAPAAVKGAPAKGVQTIPSVLKPKVATPTVAKATPAKGTATQTTTAATPAKTSAARTTAIQTSATKTTATQPTAATTAPRGPLGRTPAAKVQAAPPVSGTRVATGAKVAPPSVTKGAPIPTPMIAKVAAPAASKGTSVVAPKPAASRGAAPGTPSVASTPAQRKSVDSPTTVATRGSTNRTSGTGLKAAGGSAAVSIVKPSRPAPTGAAVTPSKSQVKSQVTAAPALEDHVTYQYNALGRRDPFQSLMEGEYVGVAGGGAAPDLGGLKVVGIVWGSVDQFAMAEDVRGNSYVLRRGDRVMNGYVEGLKRDAMVVNITVDGQSQSVSIPVTRKGERSNASR